MPRRNKADQARYEARIKLKGRTKHKLQPAMEKTKWKPGQSGNPKGRPAGKTLLTRVREVLRTHSQDPHIQGTRFDVVAHSYVRAMEVGSFQHLKEFIDREEGRVPQKVEGADGGPIKLYIGMPTEGGEAP